MDFWDTLLNTVWDTLKKLIGGHCVLLHGCHMNGYISVFSGKFSYFSVNLATFRCFRCFTETGTYTRVLLTGFTEQGVPNSGVPNSGVPKTRVKAVSDPYSQLTSGLSIEPFV